MDAGAQRGHQERQMEQPGQAGTPTSHGPQTRWQGAAPSPRAWGCPGFAHCRAGRGLGRLSGVCKGALVPSKPPGPVALLLRSCLAGSGTSACHPQAGSLAVPSPTPLEIAPFWVLISAPSRSLPSGTREEVPTRSPGCPEDTPHRLSDELRFQVRTGWAGTCNFCLLTETERGRRLVTLLK